MGLPDDELALLFLERQHAAHERHDRPGIAEEEERREDHDDQVEEDGADVPQQGARRVGGDGAQSAAEIAGDLPQETPSTSGALL